MWTPLINAANNGHMGMVELLLANGAALDFKDKVWLPWVARCSFASVAFVHQRAVGQSPY